MNKGSTSLPYPVMIDFAQLVINDIEVLSDYLSIFAQLVTEGICCDL
jgi:hypothetical protein